MPRLLIASLIVAGLTGPALAEPADPNNVTSDRTRADTAARTVDLDAKLVDVDVQRVDALKVAWDRAIAQHHPEEAGRFAKAHAEALDAQHRGEDALRTARAYLAESREQLRADEFRQQND
jgi:hypothetical protein